MMYNDHNGYYYMKHAQESEFEKNIKQNYFSLIFV